jgi:drug/metabolite transporter (DMT)-like permease
MLPAVLTAGLFAVSVICGHRAARLVGSLEANFWRVVVATVILTVWGFTVGTGLSGGALGWFALSGAVGIGIGDYAYFYALPRLGPRTTALFNQCLMAPFGALIEWAWLGVHPSAMQGIFGIVTLVGVGIALQPPKATEPHRRITPLGLLLAMVGAAGGAGGAIISRKAFEIVKTGGQQLDPVTAGFQRMLGGLAVSLVIYTILRIAHARMQEDLESPATAPPLKRPQHIWPWILANALAGQTLGVSCMQWALATSTSAAAVLVIVSTTPILVIPLAHFFEGERITLRAVLGTLVAVGGVAGLILAH